MFVLKVYEEIETEEDGMEQVLRASFLMSDAKNVGKIIRTAGEMVQEELDPKTATATTSTAFRTAP